MKRFGRPLAALLIGAQIVAATAVGTLLATAPARAAAVCATPGNDGSPGTLSGVYNSYYAPPATSVLSAGSTSISLGTLDTAGGGASTPIAAGDELLIIQMQDGSFNDTNGSTYGDGASGSGQTSLGSAGLYEYVLVDSVNGSTATITSTGSGGGLLNTYTEAPATATSGQKTYQIVRVPQYLTATLSSNFSSAYWDGQTGGVAAIDMASTLNLGGASIYATGNGFRGGAVSDSSTSPASALNSDYAASVTMNGGAAPADGSKGEGIMGTPSYIFYYSNFSTPGTPAGPTIVSSATADGYPGGDMARGAPGNAGGGGTDDDMAANSQNTGGGGGGNGGAGGNGGYPWTPSYNGSTPQYSQYGVHTAPGTGYAAGNFHDLGGRGGVAEAASASRIFMGGGGGAGTNNNGTNPPYGSSGGVGGGIILMRLANTSGTAATLYANGTTGAEPQNDGGGGGGAGGTIVITSPSTFSGITAYAEGAAGTGAGNNQTATTYQHGPGGGGGGGVVLSSSSVSGTVTGGAAGTTIGNASDTYGANPGGAGIVSSISAASIPGVSSGAECYSPTGGNMYTGPYDATNTANYGASMTGSFDGSVPATNNNDFTARPIPLTGATPINSGTVAGSWIGNALTLSSAPTVNVPNELYYKSNGTRDQVTLTATPPTGWTAEICPDSSYTANGVPASNAAPVLSTPNCAFTPPFTTCKNKTTSYVYSAPAAGSTSTLNICVKSGNTLNVPYWVVYTGPTSLTAFARYDGSIAATDDQGTTTNFTHNELYAGYIPVTKTADVVSTGCPSGTNPTLPVSDASGAKVCPGGVVQYTLDYRNIMAGAGQGTEGALASAFLVTSAGQLAIADDGTTGGNTWGANSSGLTTTLGAGGSYATTCGTAGPGACGASQSGTTCSYSGAGTGIPVGTAFTCTIGGSAFQLYPQNYSGQNWQGTVIFAVTVK